MQRENSGLEIFYDLTSGQMKYYNGVDKNSLSWAGTLDVFRLDNQIYFFRQNLNCLTKISLQFLKSHIFTCYNKIGWDKCWWMPYLKKSVKGLKYNNIKTTQPGACVDQYCAWRILKKHENKHSIDFWKKTKFC